MRNKTTCRLFLLCLVLSLSTACLIKNKTLNRLIIENEYEKLKRWDKTWLNLDKYDLSPRILIHQIEKGEMECIDYILLETDYLKYNPILLDKLLEYAVQSNNPSLVKKLLRENIDPEDELISGMSFLDYILFYDQYDLLNMIPRRISSHSEKILMTIFKSGDLADLMALQEQELLSEKDLQDPKWLIENARRNHWVTFDYLMQYNNPQTLVFTDFTGTTLLSPPFSLGWLMAMYNPPRIKTFKLESLLEKDLANLPRESFLLEIKTMGPVFSGLDLFMEGKWLYGENTEEEWNLYLGTMEESSFTPLFTQTGGVNLILPESVNDPLDGNLTLDISLFRTPLEWLWTIPPQGLLSGQLLFPSPAGNNYNQVQTSGIIHRIPKDFQLGSIDPPIQGMVPLIRLQSKEGYPLFLKIQQDTIFENLLNLSLWEERPEGLILSPDFINNSEINYRKVLKSNLLWTFRTEEETLELSLCINGSRIEGIISGDYTDIPALFIRGKIIPEKDNDSE